MRILNDRGLLILVVTLMFFSVPILCTPSLGLSAVLLTVTLLIVAKTTHLTETKQDHPEKWMDAEWYSEEEKRSNL